MDSRDDLLEVVPHHNPAELIGLSEQIRRYEEMIEVAEEDVLDFAHIWWYRILWRTFGYSVVRS